MSPSETSPDDIRRETDHASPLLRSWARVNAGNTCFSSRIDPSMMLMAAPASSMGVVSNGLSLSGASFSREWLIQLRVWARAEGQEVEEEV